MTTSRKLTILGLALLFAGLACLGYVGYQLWGTNVTAHRAYNTERARIEKSWNAPAAPKAHRHSSHHKAAALAGQTIGLLSIPAIGVDRVPVLEGTDLSELDRGIGHYRSTALPGQIGNFAVAGHRITHGEPFANLEKMQVGDKIVVETRTMVYTYVLDHTPASLTVEDTAGWVLDPVPGHPNRRPSQRLITLTTCQDLFHSPDRSVGFGHLVSTHRKGAR